MLSKMRSQSGVYNKVEVVTTKGKRYTFIDYPPTTQLKEAWYQFDKEKDLSLFQMLNEFQKASLLELAYKIKDTQTSSDLFDIIKKHIEPFRKEETGKNTTCFMTILWLILQHLPNDYQHAYPELQEFISKYKDSGKEFDGLDDETWKYLWQEANLMKLLLQITSPEGKKAIFIEATTKMVEGFATKYITGGGQTLETSRRTELFKIVTNVQPIPKPKKVKRTSENDSILVVHNKKMRASVQHDADEINENEVGDNEHAEEMNEEEVNEDEPAEETNEDEEEGHTTTEESDHVKLDSINTVFHDNHVFNVLDSSNDEEEHSTPYASCYGVIQFGGISNGEIKRVHSFDDPGYIFYDEFERLKNLPSI